MANLGPAKGGKASTNPKSFNNHASGVPCATQGHPGGGKTIFGFGPKKWKSIGGVTKEGTGGIG